MKWPLSSALACCLVMLVASASAQSSNQPNKRDGLERLTARGTQLQKGDRISFFGDSITMQGGYIRLIEKAIQESEQTGKLEIELFQHGLNGGRVPTVLDGKSPWGDLGGSMKSLLEKEKPTLVVIYLGINDVWHGKKGTTKSEYQTGLKKMVDMGKSIQATIILCTPTVIGEEIKNNKFNSTLEEYAEIVRKLADEEKLVVCDLHKSFTETLAKINPENQHKGSLTYDGVHMNKKGNALLADQIAGAIARSLKDR